MKIAAELQELNNKRTAEITLTIDENVINNAKKIAEKYNINLEQYLSLIIEKSEASKIPIKKRKRTINKENTSVEVPSNEQ